MSFYFVEAYLVDFMSIIVVFLAPVVVTQKVRLRKLGGFRGQHNSLRNKVNQMHVENEKLSSSVTELNKQTVKLSKVQTDLDKAAQRSGASVEKLVGYVEENGKIQKQILEELQAEVMSQIMTAVLATDSDKDFVLDPNEVNVLVLRLKNIPGIQFNEKAFRKILKSDKDELTLADVINIARSLKDQSDTMVQSLSHRKKAFGAPTKSGSALDLFSPRSSDSPVPTSPQGEPLAFEFKPRALVKNKKQFGLF